MTTSAVWLSNPNSNAAGLPVLPGTAVKFTGGNCVVMMTASAWNGASVSLQMLAPDGQTWQDCGASTILTANGNAYAILPHGQLRLNVTGGPPTNLFATVARVAE